MLLVFLGCCIVDRFIRSLVALLGRGCLALEVDDLDGFNFFELAPILDVDRAHLVREDDDEELDAPLELMILCRLVPSSYPRPSLLLEIVSLFRC